MKTTGALLREQKAPFEVTELELREPGPDEVLVDIRASGVCASDAHTRTGRIPSPLPAVLGHEGSGVVLRTGANVTHVAPGDHVALSWMPSCDTCRHCRAGRPVLCTAAAPYLLAGTLLDGSTSLRHEGRAVHQYSFLSTFADAAVVPKNSAIKVDPSVPFEVAALIGCAVLTGYGAAVNRAGVTPGSTVLIFGAGGVGLSAIMGARVAGAAQIIVVDPAEHKRAEALGFGATHTLSSDDDVVARVAELSDGFGADFTIDGVGAPGILDTAFRATVKGGTIVCVGMPAPGAQSSITGPALVRDEKIVTGSLYGSSVPQRDVPMIAELYRQGRLPLDRLITQRYRLEQINEAFDDLEAGRLNRGVIVFDSVRADDSRSTNDTHLQGGTHA
ncbi:Zn-dependent alcohol dehydrogenase [Leucobacter weissii]|uniref:Zn-dependent alcohol dehydrogenase n=1 Tax=Leucobacter weissii TaxID=1983706 RepID=A0A939MK84_9MICO|nr:Zn-dependent alcohol dehydrogenase [Leucobacter weissii]MBO1900347.1 Zn-dependent alcohol dehydrogenase [Leucobacter weissii]